MEELFGTLESQFSNKLPFVVYKKPNSDIISAALCKNDALEYLESSDQQGFIFAPFNNDAKPVIFQKKFLEFLHTKYEASSENDSAKRNLKTSNNKNDYKILVADCIDTIKSSSAEKIVLSRKQTVDFVKSSPLGIFKKLLNQKLEAFNYLWYHPKVGCWIGATPEFLFEQTDDSFKTMGLAGTKTADRDWTSKEIKEHKYVVDYILSTLKSSSTEIKAEETKTIAAGGVEHLQTLIKGRLKYASNDLIQLISKLHPTPAVCGVPKELAKDYINTHEGYNREFYCGYLGEFNMGSTLEIGSPKTVLFVNLRCMKIEGDNAHIFVGGGITSDSDPEMEWIETVNKSKTMMQLLE